MASQITVSAKKKSTPLKLFYANGKFATMLQFEMTLILEDDKHSLHILKELIDNIKSDGNIPDALTNFLSDRELEYLFLLIDCDEQKLLQQNMQLRIEDHLFIRVTQSSRYYNVNSDILALKVAEGLNRSIFFEMGNSNSTFSVVNNESIDVNFCLLEKAG